MSAVASSFTQWTNRASSQQPSATRWDGRYGSAGVPQNDNHQRRSNADASIGIAWNWLPQGYRTRMWTELSGQHYFDWVTEPAAPPANVLVSQFRSIHRGKFQRLFSRVN